MQLQRFMLFNKDTLQSDRLYKSEHEAWSGWFNNDYYKIMRAQKEGYKVLPVTVIVQTGHKE